MVLVIIAGHIDLSVGSVAAFVGICVRHRHARLGPALVDRHPARPRRSASSSARGRASGWPTSASRRSSSRWPACCSSAAPTSSSASPTRSRCPRTSRRSAPATCPRSGPNTGYNNLTLLLGLLAVAVVIFGEIRAPPRRRASSAPRSPTPWVIVIQLVLICGAILCATLLFATGRPGTSLPDLRASSSPCWSSSTASSPASTVIGRHIYAVGGNRHAAELSGVKTKKVNFLVMMNMSVLAALAGMIFVGPLHRLRPARTASAGSSTPSPPCSSVARPSPAVSAP